MSGLLDLDRDVVRDAAEEYLRLPRPLFTRVPVPYRWVPLPVRARILGVLAARNAHEPGFPAWPVERGLDAGYSPHGYEGRQAAVLITHDIDSRAELGDLEAVRSLERPLGLVSSFGFVPRVSWPGEDVAGGLAAEGCELYMHDIAHNGRLPFMDAVRIGEQIDEVFAGSPWAREHMRAFRSGQLLASPALLDAVAGRFDIDMSIPDTERDGPYGGRAGCGTVFPFRLRGLLEIPVSMPQEIYLRHVHGLSGAGALGVWREKLAYIRSVGGVASLNLHPVWLLRDREVAAAAAELLGQIADDPELLVTTPSALARIVVAGG